MRGLWLADRKLCVREDLPIPIPGTGEALVRVRTAGICGTDLELLKGYYPFEGIPGHEFVGEIATAVGAPPRIGQRVVGEINAACGRCCYCQSAQPTHCAHRTVLGIKNRHGAFAEYLTLPLTNLIPVSDAVSDDQAVFVEPLAAALQIQQQVAIHPADRVLIVGAGRLGLLIAQVLRLTGCELHVLARHRRRQSLLAALGIAWITEEQLRSHTFDRVIEATGSPGGFELARRALRPRGTLILKSTYQGDNAIDLSSIVVDELTIVGSRCGPFVPALRLLEARLVDTAALIDARFALEEGTRAFQSAARPGALKMLLETD